MTPPARPLALNRLVGVVACAGIACVVWAVTVTDGSRLVWWRCLAALALTVIAEFDGVIVRRGASGHLHGWREAVFVLGLGLVPPATLVLILCIGAVAIHVGYRRSPQKIIFNTAAVAIEITVGTLIVGPAHFGGAPLHWNGFFGPTALALILVGTLTMALVSSVLTTTVIAVSRGRSAVAAFPDATRLGLLIWARNVGAALAVVAALAWSPLLTLALVLTLLAVHVISVDRTRIREERFAWQRLQTAIDELRDVELDGLIAEATTAAATMMRADAAEIELDERTGHVTLMRASDIEQPHAPSEDDAGPGHSMAVELATREGRIGELRLLFTRPVKLNTSETNCLNAFANALAVALANALKFESISNDALERIRAAYIDPVTGVGNLMMLEEESRAALAHIEAGNLVAVAVIALNRFAEVNDLLGAHAADQMLRAVATRLSSVVRRCDVVARLHGAEYVLLLKELPTAAAGEAQAELAVRSLGTAISADGLDLTVDAHTGVACAPEDGDTLDELVRRARLAMYKARSSDVPVCRYRQDLEPPALAQLELVRDLREALNNKELILHFQPKFRLRGGAPIAAEALVRWQHPERGLIPPAEFIPLLERCGLVADLTRYVLEGSIEECARWHEMGLPLSIAVNLSARNLLDEDLPRFILECLSRHNLPTDRLICEITETAVFSRSPIAASILDQLRAAGVGLSLDDFCTGYSSLSLLRERAIDEIKIDRSFVADLGVGTRTTQIVTALIELAHRCGIVVTAEGIETVEQQQLLTTLGCDHAQGYLLAKPMAPEAVRAFFLDAMKDLPVAPLPRPHSRTLKSATSVSRWDEPMSWPEELSQ